MSGIIFLVCIDFHISWSQHKQKRFISRILNKVADPRNRAGLGHRRELWHWLGGLELRWPKFSEVWDPYCWPKSKLKCPSVLWGNGAGGGEIRGGGLVPLGAWLAPSVLAARHHQARLWKGWGHPFLNDLASDGLRYAGPEHMKKW